MRRTADATRRIRERARDLLRKNRHWTYTNDPAYDDFREEGLTNEQIRDALYAPSADKWRQEMYAEYREENNHAAA